MEPKKEDIMNKSLKIKRITGIAIFAALILVLDVFTYFIKITFVNITLALVPIVVGAIIYGPLAGFILGCVAGFLVFVNPDTIALFWPYGIIITFFICVLKMGIAGWVSGLIYKFLHNKNKKLAVTLASIIVPIVNTGLFAIAAILFYYELIESFSPEGQNTIAYLFLSFIGYNFLIEFAVNSLLSPIVLRLANIAQISDDE